MKLYLGKDRQQSAQDMTSSHVIVHGLTQGVQGRGDKLYMNSLFSSDLYKNLSTVRINYCGAVKLNRKKMSAKGLKQKKKG